MTGWTLVTGATNGIGLELAQLCAQEGHNLILVSRNLEKLNQVAINFKDKFRSQVRVYAADLSAVNAAKTVFDRVQKDGLIVENLINNAGVGLFGEFDQTQLAKEIALIQLNVITLTELCKFFIPGMKQRGKGRILNISSTAAFQPGPMMAVYYASKAYVQSFSEALAQEFKAAGIRVSTLCPGPTVSGFHEQASLGASKFLSLIPMKSSVSVARDGYQLMYSEQVIKVSGLLNILGVWAIRFLPRSTVRKLVHWLHQQI